jgi:hypothetical protein
MVGICSNLIGCWQILTRLIFNVILNEVKDDNEK